MTDRNDDGAHEGAEQEVIGPRRGRPASPVNHDTPSSALMGGLICAGLSLAALYAASLLPPKSAVVAASMELDLGDPAVWISLGVVLFITVPFWLARAYSLNRLDRRGVLVDAQIVKKTFSVGWDGDPTAAPDWDYFVHYTYLGHRGRARLDEEVWRRVCVGQFVLVRAHPSKARLHRIKSGLKVL